MTPRVLVAGYYGAGNAGDEWILSGLLTGLRRRNPQVEARVLSYAPESTRLEHGVEAIAWSNIETLAEAVRGSSLVVVGGGGLWQDYWGFDPLEVLSDRPGGIAGYGTPIILAHLLGRPSAMLGAGVGPLQAPASRNAMRDLAAMARVISVRDRASREELVACGVAEDRIHLGADLAFLADAHPLPEWDPAALIAPGPLLAVALRPWTFAGESAAWEASIAAALGKWCMARGGQVVFVPLHDSLAPLEDDRHIAERVAAQVGLPDRVCLTPSHWTSAERLAFLGTADVVLGMRYHALLAALSAGVPCVGLAYDPKVRHLMEEAGSGDCLLELEGLDPGRLAAPLIEAKSRAGDEGLLLAQKRRAGEGVRLALELAQVPAQTTSPALLSEIIIGQAAHLAHFEAALARHFNLPASHATRSEAGLSAVNAAAGELARVREELEKAKGELERSRAAEVSARTQLQMIARELTGAMQSVDLERVRADESAQQLASLRATAGVRLLDRYWRAIRRLAPEGSLARRLVFRSRAALSSLLASPDWAFGHRGPLAPSASTRWPVGRMPNARDGGWWQALARFLKHDGSQTDGAVFILAPTHYLPDEGQRSYHFARGLGSRGRRVVYAYWRWTDGDDEIPQDPSGGVLTVPLDVLLSDPDRAIRLGRGASGMVLLEFPLPATARFLAAANGAGFLTVYDAVDDWRAFHAGGQAPWYRSAFEGTLGSSCDVLVAVNAHLGEIIEQRCGRTPHIVGNGWSEELRTPAESGEVERGLITLGYVGHLTDAWFDWDLLLACARMRPAWRIHLHGYGGGWRTSRLPPNITFHGKLPRAQLAARAAGWDAGIAPFRVGAIAAAADPIKIYEYLALDLPVIATGIHPPIGVESLVTIASGVEKFIQAIEACVSERQDHSRARADFADATTWEKRLDQLGSVVDSDARVRFKQQVFATA